MAGNANPITPALFATLIHPHQLALRRRMVTKPGTQDLRCKRCRGRMLTSEDGLSCLICGHQDYGHEFKPLSLTMADARRALKDGAAADSPFRANDMDGWPV